MFGYMANHEMNRVRRFHGQRLLVLLLICRQVFLKQISAQALGALLAASAATGADDWYVDVASRQPLSRYVLILLQSILADAEAEVIEQHST